MGGEGEVSADVRPVFVYPAPSPLFVEEDAVAAAFAAAQACAFPVLYGGQDLLTP